jgi:hypothetical protein
MYYIVLRQRQRLLEQQKMTEVVDRIQNNLLTLRIADIHNAVDSALSLQDIAEAAPNTYVGIYSDAAKLIKSNSGLREWLNTIKGKSAILLYRWEPLYGHWFTVFLGGPTEEQIQIFDSMGDAPDSMLQLQKADIRKQLGQTERAIVNGLHHAPAYFNDFPLQASSSQTCGRWCLMRLMFRKLTEDQFIQMVNSLAKANSVSRDVIAVAASVANN